MKSNTCTRSMKCIYGDCGLFRSLLWKPRQRRPSSLALLQWQSISWMSMTTCHSSHSPTSKRVYWKLLQGAPVSPKYRYLQLAIDVLHSLSNSFVLKHSIFHWFCQKFQWIFKLTWVFVSFHHLIVRYIIWLWIIWVFCVFKATDPDSGILGTAGIRYGLIGDGVNL